jgi:hypothetical protein
VTASGMVDASVRTAASVVFARRKAFRISRLRSPCRQFKSADVATQFMPRLPKVKCDDWF